MPRQCLTDLALSHNNLGLLQSETGERGRAAEASFREAIRLQEHLLELQPDDPEPLAEPGRVVEQSQRPVRRRAAGPGGRTVPDRRLAYQTKAAAMRPGELKYQSDVALTYNNLGAVQSRAGQVAGGGRVLRAGRGDPGRIGSQRPRARNPTGTIWP